MVVHNHGGTLHGIKFQIWMIIKLKCHMRRRVLRQAAEDLAWFSATYGGVAGTINMALVPSGKRTISPKIRSSSSLEAWTSPGINTASRMSTTLPGPFSFVSDVAANIVLKSIVLSLLIPRSALDAWSLSSRPTEEERPLK
jgi:hypothetical protein